ncbi:hypothetical protein VCUG_01036 [Vavraia culicis subsp. floridensis]|uniref:Uncharacterized protein n=1 Tax=Vavraia culicis (isolate floridensis) TaxID=948595 RepID=L2GV57_VAVCU|nr:uncharacterized protein VCUG_01036 [Vavraia culicis subsp. floridensis]ELA47504.1 hypothetical protein VCUG_01036 [Vavraia culicis subsp. floridensis]
MCVKDLIRMFEQMSADKPALQTVVPVTGNNMLTVKEPSVACLEATKEKEESGCEQELDINKFARKVPTPRLTGVQWLNLRGFAHQIKMKRVAEKNKKEGRPPPDPFENESGYCTFIRNMKEKIKQKGKECKTVIRDRCCSDTYSDLDALVKEAYSVQSADNVQTATAGNDKFDEHCNCKLMKEPLMYRFIRKVNEIVGKVVGCCV